MNILLTGATGFSGRHVVRELVDKGHQVCCVVREKEKLLRSLPDSQSPNLSIEELHKPEDLSIDEWRGVLERRGIDSIVHSAALAREYSIPWEEYQKVNIDWTKKLAMSFSQSNISRNRFVYISTVGVYGTIPQSCPASEEAPYNPDGKYHTSKMLAEKELLKLNETSELPLTILRPSIMYGEEDYGFLYKLFRLTEKRIFPLSSRKNSIHLLDTRSFAEAIELAIESTNGNGTHIYNVSDKTPVAITDLVEYIKVHCSGGYFKTPSVFFTMLEYLSRVNHAINIKVRLTSSSWCYNVSGIQNDMGLHLEDTCTNLEKYLAWYKGVANGNT